MPSHTQDPNWDDIKTALTLVRAGSLAAAGDDLGVNYTTVARRIARLETTLGMILFEKYADGYVPTENALLLAQHAAQMAHHSDAMLRGLTGRDDRLSGRLTITASQLLIAHVLAPVIGQFCDAHPEVDLHVRATNETLDLNRREADLAIRVSRSPGDTLTGVRLTEQHTASFASPAWADRIAADPETVIDWIVFSGRDHLPKGVAERHPNARVRYRFDDVIAMGGAAETGLGVVRLPIFLGRALAGLVQVPCLPPQPYADIWVVGHPDVWASAKSTAFREMLKAHFKATKGAYTG